MTNELDGHESNMSNMEQKSNTEAWPMASNATWAIHMITAWIMKSSVGASSNESRLTEEEP